MNAKKRRFKIDTHGWGVFYRWAKSSKAALMRVVYAVFGRGYDGWEHEYWTVTEVAR